MNAKPQRPQKTRSLSFALCLLWSLWFSLSLDAQCWRSVDPRIGSVGVGRTFPGPVMPFGMVKPGPDCGVLPNAGWAPMPEPVSGFSQTHVSGTGGGQKYGNILIQPIISNGVRPSPTDYPQRRVTETIELGYYATTYESGIRTEITTNERCAHYRLHYPRHLSPITSRFSLLVDATHFLGKDSVPDLRERQQFVGAEVEAISDHEVVGYSRVRGGWNNGDAYTVYFCLQTDKPFTKQNHQTHPQQTHPQPLPGGRGADSFAASFPNGRSIYSPPSQGGAGGGSVGSLLLSFADTLVNVKVGISFVSTMQARRNIDNHGFDEQLALLRDAWEQQLQKIQITGSDAQRRMFYTALYHTMLMPIDKTGENPKWTDAPYYDDYYAIWDTYRTSSPLLTLLWPERQVAIINSLLNIYTREGYLPDARSGDCNGRTQGGSNAEVVIADAFVKGLGTVHHLQSTVYSPKPIVYSLQSTDNNLQSTDNKLQSTVNKLQSTVNNLQSTVNNLQSIDYSLALEAMLKDGDADPGADHEKHGRGGLNEYKRLGYIPYGIPRAGTRTVEYAYDDYCIAQVARGLGRNDIADEYLRRSTNWRNLWRSDYEWDDVRGYILPRDEEGRWMDSVPWGRSKVFHPLIPYTPVTKVAPWYLPWWDTFFYEALSAEYSLSIPHDVPGLIEACGGKEAFRRRLDLFFERGRYNVGNEPSFLTPCYYHWIGRPDLSTRRIHQIINDNYSDAPDGLPGNDDGGAMSSWLAFHMMGLYPNAGQDYYLLNVPMLDEYTFRLPNDRSLHVTKKAAKAFKVALNGRQLKEARITHEELMEGGELVFQAPTPSHTEGGTDDTQTPKSAATRAAKQPSHTAGAGYLGEVAFTLNRQFRTWPLSFAWQGDTLNIVCKQTTYRIPRHETEHATGFCWLNPQNDGTIYHHVGGTFLFVSADAVQQLHTHGFFVYDGITWRQIGDSENHVRADIDGTEMWIRLDTSTGLYLVTEMRGNPLGIDWKL